MLSPERPVVARPERRRRPATCSIPGDSTVTQTFTISNPAGTETQLHRPGVYAMPYANVAPVFDSAPVTTATVGPALPVPGQRPRPQRRPDQLRAGQRPGRHDRRSQQRPAHVDADGSQPGPGQRGRAGLRRARRPCHRAVHHHGQRRQLPPVFDRPGQPSSRARKASRSRSPCTPPIPRATRSSTGPTTCPRAPSFDTATQTLTWLPGRRAGGDLPERDLLRQRRPPPGQRNDHASSSRRPSSPRRCSRRPDRTVLEGESIRLQPPGQRSQRPAAHLFQHHAAGRRQPRSEHRRLRLDAGLRPARRLPDPVHGQRRRKLSTTQVATITVLNVNAPPEFDNLGALRISEGQTLNFRAFAFDPNNPGFVPPDHGPPTAP